MSVEHIIKCFGQNLNALVLKFQFIFNTIVNTNKLCKILKFVQYGTYLQHGLEKRNKIILGAKSL